jgi:hypothetical protein
MNLYYSLPENVIYEINKKRFTMDVLPKIKSLIVPGDFSFMIPENSTYRWDYLWVMVLRDYYHLLYEIEGAWTFLHKKRHYQRLNSDEVKYIEIKEKLSIYGPSAFDRGIHIMQNIARVGWKQFVKDYLLAVELSNY